MLRRLLLLLLLLLLVLPDLASHGCLDLVVLLALHAKGSDSRKAVEALLKKKLMEGQAATAWITRALTGHQVGCQHCCTTTTTIPPIDTTDERLLLTGPWDQACHVLMKGRPYRRTCSERAGQVAQCPRLTGCGAVPDVVLHPGLLPRSALGVAAEPGGVLVQRA